MEEGKVQVSFGFKKKIETKVDEKKVLKDNDDDHVHKDFLTQVDAELLNKKEEKKELIIPLIQKNRWRGAPQSSGKPEGDKLQMEAAKELMEESKQFLETGGQVTEDDENFANMAVPLLLKNKVPDGFETDDRLDVALRAEEASLADYDQIPIAAFGMAMIRGMGWTSEVGIGRTFKQNTKIMETSVRPKGLGLGASAPKSKDKLKQESKDNKDEPELEIKKGAFVLVLSGSHKRKYGVVEGVDTDNSQCIIKFALDGKSATVGQFALKAVDQKEYKSYGKDLSRFSSAYKEKSTDSNKHQNGKEEKISQTVDPKHSHKHKSKKHKHSRESETESKLRNVPRHENRRTPEKTTKKRLSEPSEKSQPKKQKYRTWLCPNLRVRMVSEKYKKGKYYREKLIVDDVLDASGHCTCRTEQGRLLDDIKQDMLETVVPRSNSDAYVIIVSKGRLPHDGKLAKVVEKDKSKCEAYVQLLDDRDVALRVSFDEMCEYAGDAEAHSMF